MALAAAHCMAASGYQCREPYRRRPAIWFPCCPISAILSVVNYLLYTKSDAEWRLNSSTRTKVRYGSYQQAYCAITNDRQYSGKSLFVSSKI